ncbi:hypothetical protein RAS1_31290 [Phycisphaerae bacterium RAS1]|nr:hypothetical protein RAS1_31290 [Phycisphaerae bacterium RAS1]
MAERAMRVYLDMCCLKWPYDQIGNIRISLEKQAIESVLQEIAEGRIEAVCSTMHDFENELNPNPERAAKVRLWLAGRIRHEHSPEPVTVRGEELAAQGLGEYDASHIAWAEYLGADVLLTTDDDFLKRAARLASMIKVRVQNPTDFVREVS